MTKYLQYMTAIFAPLLLTGCLVTAGEFDSTLTLEKNGKFSFSYDGEISVVGMQKLVNIAAKSEEEDFEPTCYEESDVEETTYAIRSRIQDFTNETRECTEEEAKEQLEAKKRENERMTAMFRALFGGIDPSTPDALEELVERTRKQKGWEQIDHRGDGIFDVKYKITGRMDRNFAFPHLEQAKGATAFIEAIVRKDNKVRIEAPGFSNLDENNNLMQLGAIASFEEESEDELSFEEEGSEEKSDLPAGFTKPNGTFRIITNGEILTNNTEEGSETESGMKVLTWEITERTKSAPVALIGLK